MTRITHLTLNLSSANAIKTVALRFSVGDDVDDGDVVYVDNVKLSYAITASSTQTINYTENSAVGILPPQITDVDNNAAIHSATITITNHQANDLLSVTGSLPGGIIASSYDSVNGVLTLTGTTTLANYQDALSHILFSNTSDSPSTVDRSLTITVNDGLADSNVATTTIHVTAIADLPFATADNVITNFGTGTAFQIPNEVLLRPNDNLLSITGVTARNRWDTHVPEWRCHIQRFGPQRRLVQLHGHRWRGDDDRPGDGHAGHQRRSRRHVRQ